MLATTVKKTTIWEDGDVTEMARFQVDGVDGIQADIAVAGITRKIFDLSSSTPTVALETTTPAVASVIFDTLQTDARWTEDSTGYNFKQRIAGTSFSTGGSTYRVEYEFTGAGGEKFWIVFEHPAKKVHSS